MTNLTRAFFIIIAGILFGGASLAYATIPPALSLIATGSGDNVQINVTGDPNVSVLLYYTESGAGTQITPLGTTNASGSFTTTISSATYGLTSGTAVQAILNGTSGPKSPVVAWPSVTSTNSLTLTPSGMVTSVGQSSSVTATNYSSNALYVSNNSNPSIANVSISGTAITLSGNTPGSTVVTICSVGTTNNCPSVYVVVLASGASQLSLSQTNVSVVSGQNLPVTMSGGNGSYAILNNSNPSVIQASVSGSVLTLSTGSTSGSASITLCSTDNAACGVVTATAGSASSVSLTFSSNAPTVGVGQSTSVNLYGPSGATFYVSSNATPSVVQANLSGTVLTLTGIAAGTSNISICASTGTCNSLTATVSYTATGTNITLSQNTLSLLSGQNANVTISGGTPPYFVTGGNGAIAQESLVSSALTVYGIATGATSVNVCSSGGGCSNLAISINGGTSTTVTTTPVVTQPVATAPVVTAPVVSTPAVVFTEYLSPGSQDGQVLSLQEFLAQEGYLTATPNGYFGPATQAAVIKFQKANGISPLGIVGPSTRAALNQVENTAATAAAPATFSSTALSTMSLAQLQSEAQTLESELAQVLAQITKIGG